MDELLEVVSEAVSAMVLYTVEADEKNTKVVDISEGAAVVKTAADYFVDIASKAAEFWVNFNRPDMRDKMLETGGQVKQATADILEAATILSVDPFSKPGKKLLLKGAKNVMAYLVVLLQQADLYEVTRIIRACGRVTNKKAVVHSLPPGESYFATGAQELVTHTVELGKAITKRIKEIDDYSLRRRFEDATIQLRAQVDLLLQAMAGVMRSDPAAKDEADVHSADIDRTIDEIIIVTKLSAKSPFDLSMIEGLDLKDDEDLQDLAMLVKNNLNKLQRAIDMGDGREANAILMAVKNGLNDLIAMNRALAKNCDDPVLRTRYENAAAAAQNTLDNVLPALTDAVEALLRAPTSSNIHRQLHHMVEDLQRATHAMTLAASPVSTEDLDALVQNLGTPLARLYDAVSRGNSAQTAMEMDNVKKNVATQFAMADYLADHAQQPEVQAYLHDVASTARNQIGNMLAQVDSSAQQAVIDPHNARLLAALQASAGALKSACADLVENMSVATPMEIYNAHQDIAAEQKKLMAALMAGEKRQAIESMRAIRRTLNNELALAKAVARATNDPALKEKLEAVCADAQRQIDALMGQLSELAEMALSDPNNEELRNKIVDVLGDAQALSAKLVAAVGKDLLIESNRMLADKLAELEDAMAIPDPKVAVTALRAAVGETQRQTDIARMMAANIGDDEERGTRITGYVDSLATAAPALVAATKASLSAPGDDRMHSELLKAAIKVKDTSAALLSAAILSDTEEYLQNATAIDAEMARMLEGIDVGLIPDVQQVAELVKKVSAQVKLGNAIAAKTGDKKQKEGLIKAGQALGKLMGLMVAAVRDGVANDPEKFKGFLRDAIAANREGVADAFGIEDDLNTVTDEVNLSVAQLEKAFDHGTPAQMDNELYKVQQGVGRQAFLANILANRTADPERKEQILEAVEELQGHVKELGPALHQAKQDKNNAAAQKKARAALETVKAAVQAVGSVGSGGTEGMAVRSVALAQQMDVLESAVVAGNAALANQALPSITAGLKQQAQLAKASAGNYQDAQTKKAILAYADALEKSVPTIQALVKEGLAKPNDKATHQKLSDALAGARKQMAGATVALAPSHIQPVDNVHATAQALKKDIAELNAAIKANPKGAQEVLAAQKRGAYAQQVELAKAYAAAVQDPSQRLQVEEAVAELDKNIKNFLPAVAAAQKAPNNVATVEKVSPPAVASINALNAVLAVSSLPSDDRVTAAATAASVLVSKLESDVKAGADHSASLAALKPALAHAAKAIRTAAETSRDKGALYQLADKIEGSFDDFEALARDPSQKQALYGVAQQTRESLGKAVALAAPNAQEQAAKIAARNVAEIDRLTAALESGDTASAERALAHARGPMLAQIQFAKALAEHVDDASQKQAITASADKAATLAPQLATVAAAAIKTPADKAAKAKLGAVAGETKQALAETVAAYGHADEFLVANAEKLETALDKLTAAAKAGDTNAANAALDAAQSALSQQALYARAVAQQATSPDVKKAILKDAENAEKLLPELAVAARAAIAKPSDAAAQEKLGTAVRNTKGVNKALAAHGKTAHQQRVERERKEQQEREERARKLLEEDTVETVVLRLNERMDNLKVDNTVEGKLYGTAKEISAAMANISRAAKAGDKRGMIEAARELTRASQMYVTQATAAAEKCKDPKLKEQIITNAQAAKNWSVQLKIIAAVKAASDEETDSAKGQLLKCAKGVAKAVVNTVNSVEIAAISKK